MMFNRRAALLAAILPFLAMPPAAVFASPPRIQRNVRRTVRREYRRKGTRLIRARPWDFADTYKQGRAMWPVPPNQVRRPA